MLELVVTSSTSCGVSGNPQQAYPARGSSPSQRGSVRPPLEWIVLKVTQRCNLNCDYCYVYNRGDDSWRSRPAFISEDVVRALARRIKEHCDKYSLKQFVVELHGGEPLLLGKSRMQSLLDILRQTCTGVDLKVMLQTNGLLLDEEWLQLFDRNNMTFGFSLDGPPELADRHRVDRHSKGSTERLLAIVERLRKAGPEFDRVLGGVLCVVDPSIDGAALVRWFVEHGFTSFEFLLPDGTYVNPPTGWIGPEPYRRFLLEAFEEWYHMGQRAPQIRLFEMMMLGLLGQKTTLDALGGDLRALCVVESDGSIGISDVLRICLREYSFDSLDIFYHPLDAHVDHYRVDELQHPCQTCLECPYFTGCGGGYLPHRFDGRSFAHPSIYCGALYALAKRMFEVLQDDLPSKVWVAS